MNVNKIVTPSLQVDANLPGYINENYATFVSFMETAAESEERQGFGQDVLQNLLRYVNISNYKDKIVQYSQLNARIEAGDEELTLSSAFGFPEENGVLLIDDEVILYTHRDGNTLYGLQRGASGRTVLPTLRSPGTYLKTTAEAHELGAEVQNLSVLFLVVMLERLFQSHAASIDVDKIYSELDRSIILTNIKDFFASKGSKLGMATFFKIMFGENNVNVMYPGDKMAKPSTSTWNRQPILRVTPWDEIISDPNIPYTTPDKLIGGEICLKSLNDSEPTVYGRTIVDYVTKSFYEDEVQYEISLNEEKITGEFKPNPTTKLTRSLLATGNNNDIIDTETVTVSSTLGFPESGIIIVGSEGIRYSSKTNNQFLGCTRGVISVEQSHASGDSVIGPYYLEGSVNIDGVRVVNNSSPIAIITGIDIVDGGILNQMADTMTINGPGDTAPGEVAISAVYENYDDDLVTQEATLPSLRDCRNITAGPDSVHFNDDFVFVSSSGLPYQEIGTFSTDDSVGQQLTGRRVLHTLPRRKSIKERRNTVRGGQGTGPVGMAVDGVPLWSNRSEDSIAVGKITKVNVINGGRGYVNPRVIIDSGSAQLSPVYGNGTITGVNIDQNATYSTVPTARVTEGEGVATTITFDNFGRLTGVTITSPGSNFTVTPSVRLVDASGVGRGAMLSATVTNEQVTAIEIASPGIDYNPATTTLQVTTPGSGAELSIEVESFTFDRYRQISDTANHNLDTNNAFLFDDESDVANQYAYLAYPSNLADMLGSTLDQEHSPLLGFAYDGNPIYGIVGYKNGVDDSEGYTAQVSGYYLPNDRSAIIPSGGTTPAALPPNTSTYPMGTFVEDYIHDPDVVSTSYISASGRILTEGSDELTTEGGDHINWQRVFPAQILDKNNGKVCNTPEFPAELYPDGVYCYFFSTFGEKTPTFPYIIGEDFQNEPVTQNVSIVDGDSVSYSNEAYLPTYDRTSVTFPISQVTRNRNALLEQRNDSVSVSISNLSSNGSVNSFHLEEGGGSTTIPGDTLMVDSTGTGGNGALGVVTHVTVGDGVANIDAAFQPKTAVLSRRQLIRVNENVASLTFPAGHIGTTSGNLGFIVESYDYSNGHLIVNTFGGNGTDRTLQFGDTIYDARGYAFTIPVSKYGNEYTLRENIAGGRSTIISPNNPGYDYENVSAGDLWWSTQVGRLFILFDDGDTTQWVTAQPSGMRPFLGASDVPTGPTTSTTQAFSTPQADTVVSMSQMAPSSRADGSPNVRGDLWWSTQTGNLYIWNTEGNINYDYGDENYDSQWVCTDPAATVSGEGVSDVSEFTDISSGSTVYTGNVNVIVSEMAPTTMTDGGALVAGTLWWSPVNGKMFIYYADADTSQWVVTNPTGSISTSYALDTLVDGDGDLYEDSVSILPENATSIELQVENTRYFAAGDTIIVHAGSPGTDELTENMRVVSISNNGVLRVSRDSSNAIEIPDGSEVVNASKTIVRLQTNLGSGNALTTGTEITLTWNPEPLTNALSGNYTVLEGGQVTEPELVAVLTGDEVTSVTITSAGANYSDDFYFDFAGGGGVGAKGLARVAPIESGGGVESVEIVSGGSNYTTAPTVILPKINTLSNFTVESPYIFDETVGAATVESTQPNIQGIASRVAVTSSGGNYTDLPKVLGLIKRQDQNAQVRLTADGLQIGSITVTDGGSRYSDPRCIVIDREGFGSGCTTIVTHSNGSVTDVTIVSPGNGYRDPVAYIYDLGAKIVATTSNIGQITSMQVDDYGRNISTDVTLNPEIHPTIRLVVGDVTGTFTAGDVAYTGTTTNKTAFGTILSYESERQILTLEVVEGDLNKGTTISTDSGASATILVDNNPKLVERIGTTISPPGRFDSEDGMPSAEDTAIQDSLYYQVFSYEIESELQQVEYDTVVKEIAHPAGFVMFSVLKVSENLASRTTVEDVEVITQ